MIETLAVGEKLPAIFRSCDGNAQLGARAELGELRVKRQGKPSYPFSRFYLFTGCCAWQVGQGLMIVFKERTLLERLKRLYPPYRRKRDAASREAFRQLVADPHMPCVIGNTVIPNGYGGESAPADESRWYKDKTSD